MLGIAAMAVALFWNTGKKGVNEHNQSNSMAGQMSRAMTGTFTVLTNGEIYSVAQELDTNYVLYTYGRGDWRTNITALRLHP